MPRRGYASSGSWILKGDVTEVSEEGVVPGRVLGGRYRVERLLGRGGMASVWSGVDQQMGRPIAIKVMHLSGADRSTAWARFEREARSTAAVNDPHIVTVHDTGIDEGAAYLILELLPGPTLWQYLAETGPMPIPMVLDVAAQVCEALAASHALGIVHRDIKPSNVMFADHHRVKVLDFGITQLLGQDTSGMTLTATGESLGTPAFMAPEQISGRDIDARTDLYALGCLMTAMLSGKPPFPDSSPWSVIASHAHEIPPDVRLARPDTPIVLAQLVTALLAKDPEQRPRSAADVLLALHQISAGTAQAPKEPHRPRILAAVVVTLGVLAAGVGLYVAAGAPGLQTSTSAASRSDRAPLVSGTADTPTGLAVESKTSAPSTDATTGSSSLGYQSCKNPKGYELDYPGLWFSFEAAPPADASLRQVVGDDWRLTECAYFGPAPVQIEWATEGRFAPVQAWISEESFDDATRPSAPEDLSTEIDRREETIAGHPAVRITSVSTYGVDGNDVSLMPGGTKDVRWIVELPSIGGVERIFSARAVPYGASQSGVTDADRSGPAAMDVREPAAVLDAMMKTVRFTD